MGVIETFAPVGGFSFGVEVSMEFLPDAVFSVPVAFSLIDLVPLLESI
jgi:hypothetical protein